MDLELLRAHWSATVPPDYVRPADRREALDRCCHKRCKNPVAIKKNGEPAKACLCGATHKQAYVARVVMWSCCGR